MAAGASHLVEAPTTEEALARVHAQLGADARIVDARRVRRGGFGGFFAKELVQLHAARGPGQRTTSGSGSDSGSERRRSLPGAETLRTMPRTASAEAPLGRPSVTDELDRGTSEIATSSTDAYAATKPGGEGAMVSPVDRLLAEVDQAPEGVDFATYLRAQLGAAPGSAPSLGSVDEASTPTRTPQDPITAGHAPVEMPSAPLDAGALATSTKQAPAPAPVLDPAPWLSTPLVRAGAGWSDEALLSLGLPTGMVRALAVADVDDDLAWTAALTDALRPSCRPLPRGPAVLIGPHARELEVARLSADTMVARSETFLSAVRRDRWVHLVVGGADWRSGLAHAPAVVSWSRAEDLPEAIRCAAELGLVLGFAPGRDGPTRAAPLTVALALRDLVVTS